MSVETEDNRVLVFCCSVPAVPASNFHSRPATAGQHVRDVHIRTSRDSCFWWYRYALVPSRTSSTCYSFSSLLLVYGIALYH